MDTKEMEFKINLLSQVIGQIYEAAHITHTLESIAVQYSFSEKQYNAIVGAMMRLATNKPCKRKTLKQEIDAAFGEELPALLFDQIIKGFLVSSQQQNRLDGMTYKNISQMLEVVEKE